MGWHEHHEDVFSGCEMFFRPGYVANLTSSWIPALDGVADKLAAGGRVADVGCGHGASTVLPASDQLRTATTQRPSTAHRAALRGPAPAGLAYRIPPEAPGLSEDHPTPYPPRPADGRSAP